MPVDPTGMVTLTEKGSYYLLKLNKYPLEAKTAADKPEDAADIPTKGKYATAFTVGVFSFGSPCSEENRYSGVLQSVITSTSVIAAIIAAVLPGSGSYHHRGDTIGSAA